jgi:hypothetical protein
MQVGAVVLLSVVVRRGPVATGVNGRLVARPARLTRHTAGVVGSQLNGRVSSILGDHRIAGKLGTQRGSVPGREAVNLDGAALARDFAAGMGFAVGCNNDLRNQGVPRPAMFRCQVLRILSTVLFRVLQ